MESIPFYKTFLQQELARRCEKNPRYSLRAFARAMGADPAAVSRVLSDKLCPSPKLVSKFLTSLVLSPEDQTRFNQSIEATRRRRHFDRFAPLLEEIKQPDATQELSAEVFRVIADWYHYAILELTLIPGFRGEPKWIAAELEISPAEAKAAIERLIQLGLLAREGETLIKTSGSLTTSDKHLTTPALRRRQQQILEKAVFSLENDPIETRSHSAITMAIDPRKIPQVKTKILEFGRELCRFLENGRRTEVYELSISLFSLQKRSSRK